MFKSKFVVSINQQAHLYFYGFLIILVLLFVGEYRQYDVNTSSNSSLSATVNDLFLSATDSIREMRRYSIGKEADSEHGHLDAELQHSMKLFRAQRNFYVAGFALFLYLYVSLQSRTLNPKRVRGFIF